MTANLNSLSLTRELLAFNTINPPGQEAACAQHLGAILEANGFRTRYYDFAPTRTTLIAQLEGYSDRPPLCFTGHIDTVPLGATPWSRDPWQGETDGDRLYGRGSSDMKAGVAAMVLAALQQAKQPQRAAGLTLVLTAGEETSCEGSRSLTKLPPTQRDQILGQAGAIVVGEPTANYPWVAHKGTARFKIRTRGVTAHSSMPDQGDNAIHKAAQIILKLQKFQFHVCQHSLLGSPTLNISTISGGQNINSVPDEAIIKVDIRTIPGQDPAAIAAQLQDELGSEAEVELFQQAPSMASDPSADWIQDVFSVMEPVLGNRPVPAGATYFTDASFLTPAYGNPPTVILGPGEPTMAHKTDEFCHISKIEAAATVYAEIANRYG